MHGSCEGRNRLPRGGATGRPAARARGAACSALHESITPRRVRAGAAFPLALFCRLTLEPIWSSGRQDQEAPNLRGRADKVLSTTIPAGRALGRAAGWRHWHQDPPRGAGWQRARAVQRPCVHNRACLAGCALAYVDPSEPPKGRGVPRSALGTFELSNLRAPRLCRPILALRVAGARGAASITKRRPRVCQKAGEAQQWHLGLPQLGRARERAAPNHYICGPARGGQSAGVPAAS